MAATAAAGAAGGGKSGSLGVIVQALRDSLVSDQAVMRAASERLLSFGAIPTFCHCLVQVLTQPAVFQQPVRMMAVVCIDNTVRRHWKAGRGAKVALVAPAEQAELRAALVGYLSEEDRLLSRRLAVLVGRLANKDWPRKWPQLIPGLLAGVRGSGATLRNSLYTLHRVVKEKSSRARNFGAAAFVQLATSVQPVVSFVWTSSLDAVFAAVAPLVGDPSKAAQLGHALKSVEGSLYNAYMGTKILQRLLTYAFHKVPAVNALWVQVHKRLDTLVALRKALLLAPGGADSPTCVLVSKCIVKLGRAISKAQEGQPLAFRSMLTVFLTQLTRHAVDVLDPAAPFDAYGLLCINFLEAVMKCSAYQMSAGMISRLSATSPTKPGDMTHAAVSEAQGIVSAFFNEACCANLLHFITQRCLPLRKSELEDWEDDPEEFMVQQEVAVVSNSVRAAGANLLLEIVTEHPQYLKALSSLIHTAEASVQASFTGQAVLLLDAAYLAAGTVSFALQGVMEFPTWFATKLVPVLRLAEAKALTLPQRVLLRRVLWLVSCWRMVIPKDATFRGPLYSVLLTAMGNDDQAVSLAASSCIQALLDDFGYDKAVFVPFAPRTVAAAFAVFAKVTALEARSECLHLAATVAEKAGDALIESVPSIMKALPGVWAATADQNTVRGPILDLLNQVLSALGTKSASLHSVIVPLIATCTRIGSLDELFLCESALQLWQTTLENATTYTPELHGLFPGLAALQARDTAHSIEIMHLLGHYALLGGATFLNGHKGLIGGMMQSCVGVLKRSPALTFTKTLELLIKMFPAEVPPLVEPALVAMLQCVGAQDQQAIITARYLTVFARLCCCNNAFFFAFLQRAAGGRPDGALKFLQTLFSMWCWNGDDLGSNEPWCLKTWAMAMASLIPRKMDFVYKDIEPVMSISLDVLHQQSALGDYVDLSTDFEVDDGDSRSRLAFVTDAIVKADLRVFLLQQLDVMKAHVGAEVFARVMATVEPSLIKQLQAPIKAARPGAGAGAGMM